MPDEEPKSQTFSKEMLVAVPIAATAIALTFDVGYFWAADINYFSLFSVSEHVTFATEVLPLALFASVLIAVIPISVDKVRKVAKRRIRTDGKKSTYKRVALSLLVIWFLSSLLVSFFLLTGAVAIVTGSSAVLVLLLAGWFIEYLTWPIVIVPFGYLVASAYSFAIGYDLARGYERSGTYPYTVKTDDSDLKAKVVRSGERGLLFYEQSSRRLMLIPWSKIEAVSSPSASLRVR